MSPENEQEIRKSLSRLLEGDAIWIREHREEIKSLAERLGRVEVRLGQHDVRSDRFDEDLYSLGEKMRRRLSLPRPMQEDSGSKWLAFLNLLAVAPKYLHVVLSIVMAILGTLGVTIVYKSHTAAQETRK